MTSQGESADHCFTSPLCYVPFVFGFLGFFCQPLLSYQNATLLRSLGVSLQSRDVQRSDHVAERRPDAGQSEHRHHLVWK